MPSYATTKLASFDIVSQTRHGADESKHSNNDAVDYLDPRSDRETTLSRIADYRRLFASQYTKSIVTRRGQGPSAWTAHRGVLGDDQIVHHLLAGRMPGQLKVWYGARSFQTSRYLCLDVDADRTPEQLLAKKYPLWERMPQDILAAELGKIGSQLTRQKPRPSFADRCSLVERAFRRMGIQPEKPLSVLIQRTPSGGRHYYVFFDASYSLEQYHELLRTAGLQHVPGEIEFYPSLKQGLRLPFGLVPGQTHDPNAWIQFIDDYRNGRILRHSLANLHSSLAQHRSSQQKRIESVKQSKALLQTDPTKAFCMGVAKRTRISFIENNPKVGFDAERRFLELLDHVDSHADAEELMSMGIVLPGTRTRVLNHLVAHLVWFRHYSADDAAMVLTEWAVSTRHASKDIADDLTHGTTKVAKHIRTMCRWYAANKQPPERFHTENLNQFARQELLALRSKLDDLSADQRADQAHFLLHFLRFAKRHGWVAAEKVGWDAAAAVNAVIKRWPGCHHMNYATRIMHAVSGGYMEVVKEAWHRPNGRGRARTYRLSVPVVPESDWVMTYQAAFNFLIRGELECSFSELTNIFTPRAEEEPSHANNSDRPATGDPTDSDRGTLSSPLSSPCPGASLDTGPRQRHPQPHATSGLHR